MIDTSVVYGESSTIIELLLFGLRFIWFNCIIGCRHLLVSYGQESATAWLVFMGFTLQVSTLYLLKTTTFDGVWLPSSLTFEVTEVYEPKTIDFVGVYLPKTI